MNRQDRQDLFVCFIVVAVLLVTIAVCAATG